MASDKPDEPVTAVRTLEKLTKLTQGKVSAVSPQKRVRVTLEGVDISVEIRREGFQALKPDVLAEEVVHGVNGALRGLKRAKNKLLDEYRATRPAPKPMPEADAAHIRQAQETVTVKAGSPGGMVTGTWAASGGLKLKIKAVNESHREQLAAELGTILTELSAKFREQMRTTTREARRQLREERA